MKEIETIKRPLNSMIVQKGDEFEITVRVDKHAMDTINRIKTGWKVSTTEAIEIALNAWEEMDALDL